MKSFMLLVAVSRDLMNVKNHLVVATINLKSVVVTKQPFLSIHQEKLIRNDLKYVILNPKTIIITRPDLV